MGRQRSGHLHAVAAGGDPGGVGLVEQQERRRVEVHEVPEPNHGAVEDVLEVERRGQRLRHPVERLEQLVRLGQAAEAVECKRLLTLGLGEDATGVAGHHRHEQQ